MHRPAQIRAKLHRMVDELDESEVDLIFQLIQAYRSDAANQASTTVQARPAQALPHEAGREELEPS